MSPISNQQIDALLPFLDRFQADGFSAGTWRSSPGTMSWFELSDDASEFLQALQANGWATPFDWPSWQDEARKLVESPKRLDSADAETIQRLFVTHLRKERFCEGHLAAMFENGHFVALLKRLKAIRGTDESPEFDDRRG